MRIGFLFNHDQIHQIAHSLPIACALANGGSGAEIVIATTNARLTAEVRRLLALLGTALPILELGLTSRASRLFAAGFEALFPAAKLAVYRDHLAFFRSLDALVVAEKTSAILKTRYGLHALRLIHTRHGAGDRAIGFDKASARFDHVLVSGEKIRTRLIRDAGVPPETLSVVGYPKFDLLAGHHPRLPVQANGRPTVLYNPHPAPRLSSWYRHGRQVIEYFRRSGRYNLIFAPHVMLFHRRFVVTLDPLRIERPGRIERGWLDAPNILVDVASPALSDMTYTIAADIYLGDASSQVYEFLHRPRPCIFLDSHETDHAGDPDYRHWQAGQVIRDPAALDDALAAAVAAPERFAPAQAELFAASFDLTDERSSERAARAILGVLGAAHG